MPLKPIKQQENRDSQFTKVNRVQIKRWFLGSMRLFWKFPPTPSMRKEMLEAQEYRCANPGCRKELDVKGIAHVDHNHKNGFIRGILCRNCNIALGNVYDDTEILQGLIEYLNEFKRNE